MLRIVTSPFCRPNFCRQERVARSTVELPVRNTVWPFSETGVLMKASALSPRT
jgi:hypothetical protein